MRTARLLLVAVLLLLLLPSAAATAQPAQAASADVRPTVLVGVAGLAWADVDRRRTPTLWALTDRQAVGSVTVRSVRARTCAVDGWLSISAGRRAGDDVDDWCRPVPEPQPAGSGAQVADWPALVRAQDDLPYDAELGLLGDTLSRRRACATAVGPGAAMALADRAGRVARYLPTPAGLTAELLGRCPLAVVDLGALPRADEGSTATGTAAVAATAARAAAAAALDRRLGALRAALPDAELLVAGIADTGPTAEPVDGVERPPLPPPGLRVGLWAGPEGSGVPGPRWLDSRATRWTGLVQLLDLSPTLLAAAGLTPPDGFVGKAWTAEGEHPADTAETLAQLLGAERAAQVFRVQSGPFFLLLGLVELLAFGAAYVVLGRRPGPRRRRRVLDAVHVFALAAAAFPVASFLVNLVHWWRFDPPGLVLWPVLLLMAAVIALVAATGPWRRQAYGPSTVVAGVTAAVLAVDVLTGSVLQRSSLLGLTPLTAGRFYGFGNIAYAVFAAACLVLAAGLAQALLDRGATRRTAALAPALVGAAAVVVGGAPFAGADFGGVIASVCGFALLTLGVLGARVTWQRILLVAVAAVVVVMGIAVLDWLRPPDARTHLGDFVQSILDGTAGTTVLRKGDAAIGTLALRPYYGWLVPIVYAWIVLALRDPRRWRAHGLPDALRAWPLLRPLVWAGLVTGAVGFAVNDSGIIVPALLLTIAIPLVVAATARAQLLLDPAARPLAPTS